MGLYEKILSETEGPVTIPPSEPPAILSVLINRGARNAGEAQRLRALQDKYPNAYRRISEERNQTTLL